jgi:hypothetical protein
MNTAISCVEVDLGHEYRPGRLFGAKINHVVYQSAEAMAVMTRLQFLPDGASIEGMF